MVALARNQSARRIAAPIAALIGVLSGIDVSSWICIYYESMYTSTHREYWEYNICMYACMYACIMYVCMYVCTLFGALIAIRRADRRAG